MYKKAWCTCTVVVLLIKPIGVFYVLVTVRVVGSLLSECTLEKTFRSINSPGLSMLEHKNLKR